MSGVSPGTVTEGSEVARALDRLERRILELRGWVVFLGILDVLLFSVLVILLVK
jgi:hypothetical protein